MVKQIMNSEKRFIYFALCLLFRTLAAQNDRSMTVMDKMKHYAGLFLIITGTLALILTRLSSLGGSNLWLLTGLLLIVAGIIVHIAGIKRDSRY